MILKRLILLGDGEAAWAAERQQLQEEKEAILRGHTRELEAASTVLRDATETQLTEEVASGCESILAAISAAHASVRVEEDEEPSTETSVVQSHLGRLQRRVETAMAALTKSNVEILRWHGLARHLPEAEAESLEAKQSSADAFVWTFSRTFSKVVER